MRRANESVAESLAFREVVSGEQHVLNPDESESCPSEISVGVLKDVMEASAHRWVGKCKHAED